MAILIVDDEADNRYLLQSVLNRAGYSAVIGAANARETFRLLGMEDGSGSTALSIDVILLDILLPDLDGIEVCRRIKRDDRLRDIPILMVTSLASPHDLETAFDAGSMDYLVKPINMAELLARLRSALTLKREMDWRKKREKELVRVTQELEQANHRLERMSSLDGLTEIPNRRAFDRFLDRAWRYSIRKQVPLSLIMADLDHFKIFNDTYGHQRGDACLKRVAQALNDTLHRPTDMAARYGGEEFGIVLSETDQPGSLVVAASLRRQIEGLGFKNPSAPGQRLTISLGVASVLPSSSSSPATLIAAADEALYQAKHEGRNCVCATGLVMDQSTAELVHGTQPNPSTDHINSSGAGTPLPIPHWLSKKGPQ
jgi:diguanylate cyclase (GGDEF)-like protein